MIYEGACSCQESYIGDAVRDVEIRWQEHEDTQKDSEPTKHLKNNPAHSFISKVLLLASKQSSLNERVASKKLLLFRNGVP